MGQICEESNIHQTQFEQKLKTLYQKDFYQRAPASNLSQKTKPILEIFRNEEPYLYLTSNKEWQKHKEKDEYYLGDWKDGQMVGEGIIFVPNKYAYCGSFNKLPDGNGKIIFFDRQITYQGEISKGSINGHGRVSHNMGMFEFKGFIQQGRPKEGQLHVFNPESHQKKFTVTLNNYPQTNATIDYEDHKYYEGQINTKTFLPEGKGRMLYPNKNVYQGEWLAGKYHGYGTFNWPDGSRYEGQYENGLKSGKGQLVYPSKKKYQGNWFNGKQDGYGTLYSENGEKIHQGKWKNGEFIAQE